MRLVLYQPEIANNAGAAVRVAACFGAGLDIIEPCGFPFDAKALRRTAMDYGLLAPPTRHRSWAAFIAAGLPDGGRLVLLSTRGAVALPGFAFRPDDRLIVGRESSGAPAEVHAAVDEVVRIPIAPGARSLNMAVAAAVALAEARRQTGW